MSRQAVSTVVLVLVVLLVLWGMRAGWRARTRRSSALVPSLSAAPAELGAARLAPVDATYVSTTRAGDWLDRVTAQGNDPLILRVVVQRLWQNGQGGRVLERLKDLDPASPDSDTVLLAYQQLVDEFDQLYEEGATRRRMMTIGLHDRISGHPSRVRALDRVLSRLREREDVWWARRDEIARWTLDNPATALWVDRNPAPISGLPGRSA